MLAQDEDTLERLLIEGMEAHSDSYLAHCERVDAQFARAAARPMTQEEACRVLNEEIAARKLTLNTTAYVLAVDALEKIPAGHRHPVVVQDFVRRLEQYALAGAPQHTDEPFSDETSHIGTREIVKAYTSAPLEIQKEWPGFCTPGNMLRHILEEAQKQKLELAPAALQIFELCLERIPTQNRVLTIAAHILETAAQSALKRALRDDGDMNVITCADVENAFAVFGEQRAAYERKLLRLYGPESKRALP